MQLEEVKHHTVSVNGIKIHYPKAGNGRPVFLLHGFPETWFGWRKQIPVLTDTGLTHELRNNEPQRPRRNQSLRDILRKS